MIGIGVTTYNREDLLKTCIDNIIKNTKSEYKLVVVDDYSKMPIQDERCQVIRHESRRGVASSKNDCLRFLKGCEHFFLFDDDCWPKSTGWESQYIRISKETDCHLMCYTWETLSDGTSASFSARKGEKIFKKNLWMEIDGKKIPISEEELKDQLKFRLDHGYGYGYGHAHVIKEEVITGLKYHDNGHGCMMYMDKKCIETIGGFYEGFPLYGGEHVDYFIRGFNCNLAPFKFVDIFYSDRFFTALDRNIDHVSSIKNEPGIYDPDHVDQMMKERKFSTEKVDI